MISAADATAINEDMVEATVALNSRSDARIPPARKQHPRTYSKSVHKSIQSSFVFMYATTQCHVGHAMMVCDTLSSTSLYNRHIPRKQKKKPLAKGALTRSMLDRILPSMLAWTTRICPALSATIETYLSQNRDSGETCRRKTKCTVLGLFHCGPAHATRKMDWDKEWRKTGWRC